MKVQNNQNPFILLLPTGTYHENLVIWIFISSKSSEFRLFSSLWKILCRGWNHIFQVKVWQNFTPKKNTGPYCRQYKSAACFFLSCLPSAQSIFFCQKRWMMPWYILIACYAHFGPLIGTSCTLQSQNVHNRTQSVFGHHQTQFGWANGQSRKKACSTTIKTQC
jgi:hypothetical protein